MKKLLFSLFPFILISIFSLSVKASGLPSVIPSATQTQIMDFANTMPDIYLHASGISPINGNFIDTYNSANSSVLTLTYDFDVKPFSSLNWSPSMPLWDAQGNEVALSDAALVIGRSMGGDVYFIHSTTTGEILTLGETFGTSVSTLNYVSTPSFKSNLSTIVDAFPEGINGKPLAIFDTTTATAQQYATYEKLPYSCYTRYPDDYFAPVEAGAYYFCSCANLPGTLIGKIEDGHQAFYASAEGKGMVDINFYYGYWDYGPYVVDGVSYDYKFPPRGVHLGQYNGKMYNYTPQDDFANKATYYYPSNEETLPDVINYDKYYAHPSTKSQSPNNNYDPNNDPSTINSPMIVNYYYYPDYTPPYDYIDEIEDSNKPQYDPEETPSIDDSTIPDFDSSDIVDGKIPLIEGLQNKFPFSIPFDIYNIVKGLEVQREIPVLDFEIEFPIINYTWEISIDMSMYDDTAALFRLLFLILFIIGLALFSYRHYFGQ